MLSVCTVGHGDRAGGRSACGVPDVDSCDCAAGDSGANGADDAGGNVGAAAASARFVCGVAAAASDDASTGDSSFPASGTPGDVGAGKACAGAAAGRGGESVRFLSTR